MTVHIERPPFVPFVLTKEFTRKQSDIRYCVLHDTEGLGTIEGLTHYFENTLIPDGRGGTYRDGIMYMVQQNGRMGSLGDFTKGVYHVQSHNLECVGIEQFGYASQSTKQWYLHLHQLWGTALICAWVSQELDIPLVRAAHARRFTAQRGFLQHADCPANTHTDCGPNYPFEEVLYWAQNWRNDGVPEFVLQALNAAR